MNTFCEKCGSFRVMEKYFVNIYLQILSNTSIALLHIIHIYFDSTYKYIFIYIIWAIQLTICASMTNFEFLKVEYFGR